MSGLEHIALRHLFAVHGIPEQDNGPQFISEEFARTNGIRHIRCSPASNGEAERLVRTFKEAMKTGKGDGLTLTHRLDNPIVPHHTLPLALRLMNY